MTWAEAVLTVVAALLMGAVGICLHIVGNLRRELAAHMAQESSRRADLRTEFETAINDAVRGLSEEVAQIRGQ